MSTDDQLIVHLGTVSHKHGTNTYASHSREGLMGQLAQYVREYWSNLPETNEPAVAPDDDEGAVQLYFDWIHGEFLETTTVEVLP